MSYLVLARKYRPQTFDDVVGQDAIMNTIKNAITTNRVAHAFLFTGSRGVGKTTMARILAKALCCVNGATTNPCGTCVHCQEITEGRSLDVIEIDGASNTGVDDVRELREAVRYQPTSARYKIFIIDEVHMLSTSAFNALLKTLEEPPPHVKFIFATTEPHKIPITIISRCQRYDFKRISAQVIEDRLNSILAQEKIQFNSQAIKLIARQADGGMRDALSLTDQVLSFVANTTSLEEITQSLGLIERQQILDAAQALLDGKLQNALLVAQKIYVSGFDIKQLIEGIATEFRHLALAASMGSIDGFADLTIEDKNFINTTAKNYDAQDLQRLFAMALEGIDLVARSKEPKLALELAFLRMATRPSMSDMVSITAAIAKLESLAEQKPAFSAPVFTPPKPVQQAPTNEPSPVKVDDVSLSALWQANQKEKAIQMPNLVAPNAEEPAPKEKLIPTQWQAFVDAITSDIASLGHHLEHGRLLRIEEQGAKKILHVDFDKKVHYQATMEAYPEPGFRAKLVAHFGPSSELAITLSDNTLELEAKAPALTISEAREIAEAKAQAELEQSAQEDPIVQQALSLFGGEIRSVKKVPKGV